MMIFMALKNSMHAFVRCARTVRQGAALGLAGAGLALLGGCAALPDKPVRSLMYDFGPGALPVQSATPVVAGAAVMLPPLALADVTVAGGALDSTAMFYRLGYSNAQQLRPYTQARWSMPPALLLDQRLRQRLGQQRVIFKAREAAALRRSQEASVPLLRLELEEFSQLFSTPGASAGLIRLRATLLAISPAGEQLIAQRAVTVQRPAPSADAAGGVQALSAAADAAIDELAQWLAQAGPR